jgi:Enzyme involved in the deoxyxylulose pathway of isoprenoid biosynthesis
MTKFSEFPYVADRFNAVRRETVQVRVGEALIGGNAPILVQSMTTTKPKDVEKTVAETLALAKVGCGLVRITAPTFADAQGLEEVMKQVRAAGCKVPVSADIHFQPKAAFEALKWVEKVRINPGNFVDTGILTLENQTDKMFDEGKEKVAEAFTPFSPGGQASGTRHPYWREPRFALGPHDLPLRRHGGRHGGKRHGIPGRVRSRAFLTKLF